MFLPIPLPVYPIYNQNVNYQPRRSSVELIRAVYPEQKIEEKLICFSSKLYGIEKKLNSYAITHEEVVKLKEKLNDIHYKIYSEKMVIDNVQNAKLIEFCNSVKTRLKVCLDIATELSGNYLSYVRSNPTDHLSREKPSLNSSLLSKSIQLPTDVLTEILSLIPLHKKIKLRMVSKQWRDVIDHTLLKGIEILPNFHGKKGLIINASLSNSSLKLHDLMSAITSIRKKHKWYQIGCHQAVADLIDEHFRKTVESRQLIQHKSAPKP